MPSTYGMRAVPLGPSCDLVVAGKAGIDGLWSAGIRPDTPTGKGLCRPDLGIYVTGVNSVTVYGWTTGSSRDVFCLSTATPPKVQPSRSSYMLTLRALARRQCAAASLP